MIVAGLGIAPRAGGYEPPEILLLHPAITLMFSIIHIMKDFKKSLYFLRKYVYFKKRKKQHYKKEGECNQCTASMSTKEFF